MIFGWKFWYILIDWFFLLLSCGKWVSEWTVSVGCELSFGMRMLQSTRHDDCRSSHKIHSYVYSMKLVSSRLSTYVRCAFKFIYRSHNPMDRHRRNKKELAQTKNWMDNSDRIHAMEEKRISIFFSASFSPTAYGPTTFAHNTLAEESRLFTSDRFESMHKYVHNVRIFAAYDMAASATRHSSMLRANRQRQIDDHNAKWKVKKGYVPYALVVYSSACVCGRVGVAARYSNAPTHAIFNKHRPHIHFGYLKRFVQSINYAQISVRNAFPMENVLFNPCFLLFTSLSANEWRVSLSFIVRTIRKMENWLTHIQCTLLTSTHTHTHTSGSGSAG